MKPQAPSASPFNRSPQSATQTIPLRALAWTRFKRYTGLLAVFWLTAAAFGQDAMTPARFRDLVATPGDTTPLVSQLASVGPLWTNAIAHVVLKYQTGKVFAEDMPMSVKTIGGKYIVYTGQSRFYRQPMNSILVWDEKALAIKACGLYADEQGHDLLVEGLVIYDYTKKIYSETSTYGDGFQEIMVGSYSDTESSHHALIYRHGVLFMTRESTSHPAAAGK